MGKKKTTTTNNFEYKTPPTNSNYQAAQNLVNNVDYTSDVTDSFGRAENQIKESNTSLFGADTPADVRDKQIQGQLFNLQLGKGQAMRGAKQAENDYKLTGNMNLGGALRPQLVQTSGTQSTPYSVFDWVNSPIAQMGMGA